MGLIAAILLTVCPDNSHAWLLYHKPAFKGKFIDAETKAPIEGVVVVAGYQKTLVAGFEPMTSTFEVREAVTDKDGIFRIPPLTTLINPFCRSSFVTFIIYKPGYGDYLIPGHHDETMYGADNLEVFFSKELYGKEKVFKLWDRHGEVRRVSVVGGLAELRKLTTGERLKAIPRVTVNGELNTDELPLFFQAVNEERRRYRLEEVGKGKTGGRP